MPLVSRTFDQLIDFTRTTSGTFVGSNGFIQSTPQSRNLLTYTQEFDNAAWTKTNATVTANSTTAPDGTSTADKLVDSAILGQHFVSQQFASVSSTTTYAVSVYLKSDELGFAFVGIGGSALASAPPFVVINLSTGAVSTTNGSPSNVTATNVDDGWWRLSFTATTATTGTVTFDVRTSQDGVWANRAYAGTGQGIFIWGAQAETGTTATTYTRNYGGLYPPRFDYDPVTLAPKGLLIEEQRSNLVTYSEQFDNAAWGAIGGTVTANTTTSPDGTVDADSLVEDSATSDHRVNQSSISAGSGANTFSVYLKAGSRTFARIQFDGTISAVASSAGVDVNLSTGATGSTAVVGNISAASVAVTNVGNGWYRVALTATLSASGTLAARVFIMQSIGGSTSYTGNGSGNILLYGAQLEAGAFATSYIPTVASQVTRTADVATIQAPNFAPWYNQSEGTFVASAVSSNYVLNSTFPVILTADSGTNDNRITIFQGGSATNTILNVRSGGVSSTSAGSGVNLGSTPTNIAGAFSGTTQSTSVNGAAAINGTTNGVPSVNTLRIGSSSGLYLNSLNGHIRSIRYYPTRLSNAQLQALTA